jgi:hypothetical protein
MVFGQGVGICGPGGVQDVYNPSHSIYKWMVSVAYAEVCENEDSLYG